MQGGSLEIDVAGCQKQGVGEAPFHLGRRPLHRQVPFQPGIGQKPRPAADPEVDAGQAAIAVLTGETPALHRQSDPCQMGEGLAQRRQHGGPEPLEGDVQPGGPGSGGPAAGVHVHGFP